jgi:hypothetical protein
MAERSVIGIYDTLLKAEEAVRQLDRQGFPIIQVSILGQQAETTKEVQGYLTIDDPAKKGMSAGALATGLVGLLAGAVSIWVPGFGHMLVAGPLAAALLGLLGGMEGVIAGAVWGGARGTLIGWGVAKQHLLKYEDHLRAGKFLVNAHGSAADVEHGRHILHGSSAELRHHYGEELQE